MPLEKEELALGARVEFDPVPPDYADIYRREYATGYGSVTELDANHLVVVMDNEAPRVRQWLFVSIRLRDIPLRTIEESVL